MTKPPPPNKVGRFFRKNIISDHSLSIFVFIFQHEKEN